MSADLSRRCGPVVSGPVQQRRNPRRGEARELPAPTGSGAAYGNRGARQPPGRRLCSQGLALRLTADPHWPVRSFRGLLACSEQGNVVPWPLRLGPAPSLNVSMSLGK